MKKNSQTYPCIYRNLMLPETHIAHTHTHHKTKGQERRVGRLKRRKGKHGEGWHIKVLGLARAVDWSIDRLHRGRAAAAPAYEPAGYTGVGNERG